MKISQKKYLVFRKQLDSALNLCNMEMFERQCCIDGVGMNDHTLQFDSHSF